MEEHETLGLLVEVRDALTALVKEAAAFRSRGGTPFKIAADVTTKELLPSNRFRHMATVYNDSTAVMYLALGANASPDAWTVKMNPNDYYEAPAGYTGPITAVWVTATGSARVTELT